MPRRSRAAETREAGQRPDIQHSFKADAYFPRHLWPKGFTCRWVRTAVHGEPDRKRWSNAMLNGWKPMTVAEAPQFALPNPDGTISEGLITIANLVLCKKPTSEVKRDREEVQDMTREQARALDQYVRENQDSDLPRFNRSGSTEYAVGRRMTPEQAFKE